MQNGIRQARCNNLKDNKKGFASRHTYTHTYTHTTHNNMHTHSQARRNNLMEVEEEEALQAQQNDATPHSDQKQQTLNG